MVGHCNVLDRNSDGLEQGDILRCAPRSIPDDMLSEFAHPIPDEDALSRGMDEIAFLSLGLVEGIDNDKGGSRHDIVVDLALVAPVSPNPPKLRLASPSSA